MTEDSPFSFGSSDEHGQWLAQVQEPILEPELPIVDTHHHLWVREPPPYLLREYVEDVYSGHNIVASVYADCRSMYRQQGPQSLKPVGESEFVSGMAAMSDSGEFGSAQICKAMVGSVDLSLGDQVGPVLDAHEIASGGRFRGVRLSAGWHESPQIFSIVDDPEYSRQESVRQAIGVLARRELSLDCWLYHTQLDQVAEIAGQYPNLTIVMNHSGVPILGGPYKGKEQEAFTEWRQNIRHLAAQPNINMKLGALVLRTKDRSNPDLPPSSDDIVKAWQPWIETVIESFGAERCMFESNFPVHKKWCSYPVLWNALKKMTTSCSVDEKHQLYFGTANRVYKMGLES